MSLDAPVVAKMIMIIASIRIMSYYLQVSLENAPEKLLSLKRNAWLLLIRWVAPRSHI
jgi:hypothetical protein